MSWAIVIVGAATVIGGAISADQQAGAAEDAANAQMAGANAATAEQRRQYDLSRQDQMPFLQAGYGALDRQEKILNGDYTDFENSPDYLYARGQMQQGVERGAAARGSLYAGGTNVDLGNALNGVASQNLNNYWAKLSGQAGQGYSAANNLGALGANAANQIGSNARYAGDARASGYAGQANAWSNYGQQLAGMGGQYAAMYGGGWGGV